MTKCKKKCEVFSRVVGYMRPVAGWNKGKKAEFNERVEYNQDVSLNSKLATKGSPLTTMEKLAVINN